MSKAQTNEKLGVMPYVAAIWAMSLYFTTPTAWVFTIWQLFNPRVSWLIVLCDIFTSSCHNLAQNHISHSPIGCRSCSLKLLAAQVPSVHLVRPWKESGSQPLMAHVVEALVDLETSSRLLPCQAHKDSRPGPQQALHLWVRAPAGNVPLPILCMQGSAYKSSQNVHASRGPRFASTLINSFKFFTLLCRLHPHGVLTISAWATFASEGTNFSRTFPGIDLRVGASGA